MKWIMLITAVALGLDWWFRDDTLAAVFGLLFFIAAVSLWRDKDAV